MVKKLADEIKLKGVPFSIQVFKKISVSNFKNLENHESTKILTDGF